MWKVILAVLVYLLIGTAIQAVCYGILEKYSNNEIETFKIVFENLPDEDFGEHMVNLTETVEEIRRDNKLTLIVVCLNILAWPYVVCRMAKYSIKFGNEIDKMES